MQFPPDSDAQFARERLASGCETMTHLLLGLLDSKGRVAEEIHAIRKLGKSLRGGFALFRLDQSSAREIQMIGRLLAGPRDAVSRLNTWHKLAWNIDPRLAAAIEAVLDQQTHSSARRPPPKTIEWCIERVAVACHSLHELAPENLAAMIAAGLAKLQRKTIKRCRKLEHRADKDFHNTRKALKAWLGAIGFLPLGRVAPDPRFEQLAELLGDENDLATLAAWLKSHGFTAKFAPDLWQTLIAARRELQRRIIKDAARLAS